MQSARRRSSTSWCAYLLAIAVAGGVVSCAGDICSSGVRYGDVVGRDQCQAETRLGFRAVLRPGGVR